MFKLNSVRQRRLRRMLVLTGSFLICILAFNNCTQGFITNELQTSTESLASSTPDAGSGDSTSTSPISPAPTTTTNPSTPSQPAPAPVQPIVMTNQPAWMSGKSLNEWIEIPNTGGAGGAAIQAFSGLAMREATSEIVIGAAGGHGDSADNRVVSLVLAADQPKWVLHIAPSPFADLNVSHYQDGTPSARHSYQNTYYIESLDRLFLFGARYTYGNAYSFTSVDAFSFKTNQWDPPDTWAPMPVLGEFGSVKIPGSDDVYSNGLSKWSAAQAKAMYQAGTPSSTSVWSHPIQTRTNAAIRFPMAYDKARNQIFTLQYGDGQGYNAPNVFASKIELASGVQTDITIKPSSAYSMFVAEVPVYAAMDYDIVNDRFLFYSGLGDAAGRVYAIKPSSTSTEWDMSLLQTTASSVKPPPTMGAGLNSNFKYVPALKGFVLLPTRDSNLFFIKTAQ